MEKRIKNPIKKKNLLITAIPLIPIIKNLKKKIKLRNIDYTILKSTQFVNEKDFKIIHKFDALLSGDDEITKRL